MCAASSSLGLNGVPVRPIVPLLHLQTPQGKLSRDASIVLLLMDPLIPKRLPEAYFHPLGILCFTRDIRLFVSGTYSPAV